MKIISINELMPISVYPDKHVCMYICMYLRMVRWMVVRIYVRNFMCIMNVILSSYVCIYAELRTVFMYI